MGKTIRYGSEYAKHNPRAFVIEKFDENNGLWQVEKVGRRSRARMERIMQHMRTDGAVTRMHQG